MKLCFSQLKYILTQVTHHSVTKICLLGTGNVKEDLKVPHSPLCMW